MWGCETRKFYDAEFEYFPSVHQNQDLVIFHSLRKTGQQKEPDLCA